MAVGIDIGRSSVKAAQVLRQGRSFRVQAYAQVPIEDGPDPAQARREAVAKALREVRAGREVMTALPAGDCVVRNLMVPFTKLDQIARTIASVAEEYFHQGSIDDALVEFYRSEELPDKSRIIICGVEKPKLAQHLAEYAAVEVDPARVTLDTAAFAACYTAAPQALSGLTTALAVEIGAQHIHAAVFVDGRPRAFRCFRLREFHLFLPRAEDAEKVVKATRIPSDLIDTDEFKLAKIPDMNDSSRFPVVVVADVEDGAHPKPSISDRLPVPEDTSPGERYCSRLVGELRRTLASVELPGPVERIYIAGGGAKLPVLPGALELAFGCEVRETPLSEWYPVPKKLDKKALDGFGAPAVGLALGALGAPGCHFDFRKGEFARHRSLDLLRRSLAATAALAFLLVFLLAWSIHIDVGRLNMRIEMLKRYQAVVFHDVLPERPIKRADAIFSDFQNALSEMEEATGKKKGVDIISALDMLRVLSLAKRKVNVPFEPENIKLDQQHSSIKANAKEQFNVQNLVDAINLSDILEATPVKAAVDPKLGQFVFEIRMEPKKKEE